MTHSGSPWRPPWHFSLRRHGRQEAERRYRPIAARIVAGFAIVLVVGTLLLMLPVSMAPHAGEPPALPDSRVVGEGVLGGAPFVSALFTATSALCVTGLVVVDTLTYWSTFGHAVILVLIHTGGMGVMVLATLAARALAKRFSLGARFVVAASTNSNQLAGTGRVIGQIVRTSLIIEGIVAVMLTARLLGRGEAFADALWNGVFLAISAFNNAGFAMYSDNLMWAAGDAAILLPIAMAVILGGLGFPVLVQLWRDFGRPRRWHVGTHLVIRGTIVLLVVGTVMTWLLERSNRATLGGMSGAESWLNAFFASTVSRTAGFNSVDISQLNPSTWAIHDALMFIGAGPAGTAGGIKLTTIGVIVAIVAAEVRSRGAVDVAGKRLPRAVQREVITVVTFAVVVIFLATFTLMVMTRIDADRLLFETISAFGTVGVSTGVTHTLPVAGQLILCMLMFVGRLGPLTLATSLALSRGKLHYELPMERPIIG